MARVWTIARKELRGLFDHATAYILLVVFLGLNFFFYFRAAFVLREASLRPMFELLPWLYLFFIPAVTMRTLAEEKRAGTLELVLAQPVREIELLLGKALGSLLFLGVALLATLGAGVGVSIAGDPDAGMMLGQYIGAFLLAMQFVAIGMCTSSLTRNQITAFVLGIGVSFFFIVLGLDLVLYAVPAFAAEFVGRLAVLPHYQSVSRGVLDIRDLLYFLSVAGTFLFLAYWALIRDRANRRSEAYRNLQLSAAIVPALAVALNLAGGFLGSRIDLTEGRIYTLSPATKRILRDLPDIVTLKLFVSSELPAEVALTRRDVRDLLDDYRRASRGNARLVVRNPDKDEEARSEAQSLGIPPVQFNVLRRDQFQLTQGYLGVAVQYGGSSEIVPFVRDVSDLEYRLTSQIRALTSRDTPQVAFLTGHGEKSIYREYGAWRRELGAGYEIRGIELPRDSADLPNVDVLVVAGPTEVLPDSTRKALESYLDGGGKAMLLVDGMIVNPQVLQAMPNPSGLAEFAEKYGARVNRDVVFDLRSNETVTFGGGFLSVIVPYPFWVRALAAPAPLTRDLSGLVLPWASSIEPAGDTAKFEFTPLWSTSQFAGRDRGPFDLSPNRDFRMVTREELAPRVVAAAVRPRVEAAERTWRVIVVGDSDFLMDNFVRNAPQNIAFALNAVDWLAEDDALIAIRSKTVAPRNLLFSSDAQRSAIKFGNLIGVPVLVVLLGSWRMWRRRSLRSLVYQGGGALGRASQAGQRPREGASPQG